MPLRTLLGVVTKTKSLKHLPSMFTTSHLACYLEGEFPSVANEDAIILKQVGPRAFVVGAKLEKFDVESEWVSNINASTE